MAPTMENAAAGGALGTLTETVTFYSVAPDGTTVSQSVVKALRRAERSIVEGGAATLMLPEVKWHFWVANMGGTEPKREDRFIDAAADTWLVLSADLVMLASRWELTTRQVL